MDELKPCPFCGGKLRLVDDLPVIATCTGCDIRFGWFGSPADGIEALNRRIDEDEQKGVGSVPHVLQ